MKAIDLGGMNIRYKAEIDFDGRQLTRSYLDKQDLESMMEVKCRYLILMRYLACSDDGWSLRNSWYVIACFIGGTES